MTKLSLTACSLALMCTISNNAFAWIIIPIGAIARALETDPDSISVSATDRTLGKCAGLHVNQARKHSTSQSAFPDDIKDRPESPETVFHSNMANFAVERATDKDKVKDLANAYSVRWARVAGADIHANRAYGADLAKACIQQDIPLRSKDYSAWQARQDEQKRKQLEEERVRAEETQRRLKAEEQARRSATVQVSTSSKHIDFTAEARKSARILGCATDDVRVVGIEVQNILFSATCESGQQLVLTCDPTGLCLKK